MRGLASTKGRLIELYLPDKALAQAGSLLEH